MNDTLPQLNSVPMLKRFRNWEAGFDLFNAGHPIEHCQNHNCNVTKSRIEGWKAAKCIAELAADAHEMLVFTRAKKQFNGMILL